MKLVGIILNNTFLNNTLILTRAKGKKSLHAKHFEFPNNLKTRREEMEYKRKVCRTKECQPNSL